MSVGEEAFDRLRAHAASIFRAGVHSHHGPAHWRRVEENAVRLARRTGADVTVVRLFAIYHDSCRLDDGPDPGHGPRAAALLRQIADSQLPLDTARLDTLVRAVEQHTCGMTSSDVTIGTCWDADRLDLGRVGIAPDPRFMSTDAGRELAAESARPRRGR